MKILYIAYSCSPCNGSEDKIGWNVPFESAKENEVYVITLIEQKKYIDEYLSKNPVKNLHFAYIDIPSFYKKIFKGSLFSLRFGMYNRRAFKEAKKLCAENDIRLIHQVTPIEFRAIGDYGKIKNVKYVVGPIGAAQVIPKPLKDYEKGHRFIEFSRSVANKWAKFNLKVTKKLSRCETVLFANNETKDYLMPLVKNNYSVITDVGVNESEIALTPQSKEEKDGVEFLYAGRLIYWKGLSFLFDALELLPENANYQLKIVGDGRDLGTLKARCESSNKLKSHVVFFGKVPFEKMNEKYRSADAFVFPTLRDTSGMVVIEALSQGLPVITINSFGVAVIVNEKCGFTYRGKSKEEYLNNLKDVLLKCIEDKKLLNDLANSSVEEAKKYTWQQKYASYKKFYE